MTKFYRSFWPLLGAVALVAAPLSAQSHQDSVAVTAKADTLSRQNWCLNSRAQRLVCNLMSLLAKPWTVVAPPPPPPPVPPAPPPPPPPPPMQVPPNAPGPPNFALGSDHGTTADVAVAWTGSTGATSYRYASGGGSWAGQSGVVTLTSMILLSAPRGMVIWTCVWARNSAGESADNACNSFSVPVGMPAPVPPPPPAPVPPPAPPPVPPPPAPPAPTLTVSAFWIESSKQVKPIRIYLPGTPDSAEVCAFLRFSDGAVGIATLDRQGWCGQRVAQLVSAAGAKAFAPSQQAVADTACQIVRGRATLQGDSTFAVFPARAGRACRAWVVKTP